MDNDTVQFLIEGGIEELSILFDALNTDHNIARYEVAFDIVKGDNIGIGVVVEVGAVNLNEVGIIAEKITDVTYLFILSFDNVGNPFFDLELFFKVKSDVFS